MIWNSIDLEIKMKLKQKLMDNRNNRNNGLKQIQNQIYFNQILNNQQNKLQKNK